MKIGLIFHGPEVIDTGEAEFTIDKLREAEIEFEAKLGGITGKTAVIDRDLENVIDIDHDKSPSQVLEDFYKRGIKFVIFVNHGKKIESGILLGCQILKKSSEKGTFIQIEYAGRIIIPWVIDDEEGYERIRKIFGFEVFEPMDVGEGIKKEENIVRRKIGCTFPGEKIVVNGVVVGVAQSEEVILVERDGRIVGMEGGSLIEHNLPKLGKIDLENAMVKSVSLFRRTEPVKKGKKEKRGGYTRIFFQAEEIYRGLRDDMGAVVTIGDDTTAIIGDILTRFNIPLIGITDGDADGLIHGITDGSVEEMLRLVPKGSVIVRLPPESDDRIGEMIKKEVFGGKEATELDFEEVKRRVMDIVRDKAISIEEKFS
ncbi:MAG: DUF2117 domain-containing protein [Candidatus Syntropharchaeia archaeon]